MERRNRSWRWGRLLLALAWTSPPPAAAVTVFDDGTVHLISTVLADRVEVFDDVDPPFGATEVQVTATGVVELDLIVHQSSIGIVNAGAVRGRLQGVDDAEISVSGADLGSLHAAGRAVAAAANTDIDHDASATGEARLTLVGGRVGLAGPPDDIFANDDGRVFVSGGTMALEDVFANQNGAIELDGATVGDDLFANDASRILATNVTVGRNLFTNGTAFVELDDATVTGDLFATGRSRIRAIDADVWDQVFTSSTSEAARIDLEGGSFHEVRANGGSSIVVTGGAHAGPFLARGTATLTVRGTGFNFPDGPVAPLSGTLTGTLLDGTPLSVAFDREAAASIVLPEPDRAAAVALGALAVGALVSARRRRAARPARRSARRACAAPGAPRAPRPPAPASGC